MAKLNFHQPFLQSSISHDPSENIKTVYLLTMIKKINLDSLENKKIKHLFEI